MMRANGQTAGALVLQYGPVAGTVFLPALFAWGIMAAAALQSSAADLCIGIRGYAGGSEVAEVLDAITAQSLFNTVLLMAAAMALPLAWQPALSVYCRGFRQERWLLCATFAGSFLGGWALFLVPITILGALSSSLPQSSLLPVLVAACVAAWRLSPGAEIALRQCHRTEPVRAFAPGCYLDAAGFGWRSAIVCCQACAPAMLMPFVAARPFLIMICVTAIAFMERISFRPNAWHAAAAYAGAGLFASV